MKLYTDQIQTAKLIDFGFAEPKSIRYPKNEAEAERVDSTDFLISDYSIGELLSLLPISFETNNDDTSWLEIEAGAVWSVSYSSFGFIDYDCERKELIDALYDMLVKLKEKGVI